MCAVCRFVDPIADIAVLGSPNAPHADDYKALTATATALPIADRVRRHPVNFLASPWLLSLDGRWFSCTIRHFGGPLWITHPAERVIGGMSGSPHVKGLHPGLCSRNVLRSLADLVNGGNHRRTVCAFPKRARTGSSPGMRSLPF